MSKKFAFIASFRLVSGSFGLGAYFAATVTKGRASHPARIFAPNPRPGSCAKGLAQHPGAHQLRFDCYPLFEAQPLECRVKCPAVDLVEGVETMLRQQMRRGGGQSF